MRNETNSQAFRAGFHDGIPIGLGYFAVAFALGVAARDAGIAPSNGFEEWVDENYTDEFIAARFENMAIDGATGRQAE
jgi:hypothetical protein